MRYVLDTHTFLWMDDQFDRLSERVSALVQDRSNELFLSYASIWEIQIKLGIGKLRFSVPLEQKIKEQRAKNGLQLLRINLTHLYQLGKLPASDHRDPFDRLLIAQAIHEGLPILSADPQFRKYPVRVVW